MKIISGKYKGKILKGFDIQGTRPTMDRIKESLFASIQNYVPNSIVLDLYAGTGNLAIEALSNGAKEVYLIDNNKVAINTINKNLKELNITNAKVKKGDSTITLKDLIKDKISFDIIFLDPPYDTTELDKALLIINKNLDIISNDGLIICETEKVIDYSLYNNLIIFKSKKYGPKLVTILKKCKHN